MSTQTVSDDVQYGHIVIVTARWLLVIAGFLFLLYRPASITEVAVGTVGVLAVAATNFWLHTRILMKQPIETSRVYGASAADLVVISVLVALQDGLASKAFVFYYPAVLCFALVFPRRVTVALTTMVLALYAILCLAANPPMRLEGDERILIARLLTLLAVAFVGNRYQEIEQERRVRERAVERALGREAA